MVTGNKKGFTLVELMIVVAVIGILAAIAYPSYVDSMRKARRADAKAALLQVAQKEEQFYARNGSYTTDMTDLGYSNTGWNSYPENSPADEQYYQVRVSAATTGCPVTNCYLLTARRNSATDQANDSVVNYTLSSTGLKRKYEHSSWRNSWKN